jgi:hypothetical protein
VIEQQYLNSPANINAAATRHLALLNRQREKKNRGQKRYYNNAYYKRLQKSRTEMMRDQEKR